MKRGVGGRREKERENVMEKHLKLKAHIHKGREKGR